MNIILYSKTEGYARIVHCRRAVVFTCLLCLLLIIVATTWLGYRGGVAAAHSEAMTGDELQQRLLSEQAGAMAGKQRSRDELEALTGRLGRLQAEMVRLNALGQRLVDVADLDKNEFDFSQQPPQGGPESVLGETDRTLPQLHELAADLERLSQTIDDREQKFAVIESLYMTRHLHEQVMPKGRPIRKGWISSYFGMRTDPFTGRREMHKGLDLAGKMGSDVLAVADGVVTWSGKRYGYGNLVEINHGNGYVTRYGHNSRLLVKPGEVVRRGQRIALMGSTGRSTGPHVHFEVLVRGRQIDPAPFVRAGR